MSRLSLVPTPIGNLADMTLRSLEVLRAVELIAAEDTRHSRTLLEHYQIATPLARLDVHTIASRAPDLLERHGHLAFITDAGTPGISDPGAELVRLALSMGVEVEVLPGATALIPALVLSGLPTARFAFEGFLPRKGSERRQRLEAVGTRDHSTVIYEATKRLGATLNDLADACGAGREASVSREMSKRFETTYRATLGELAARFAHDPPKGEAVVVVGPGRSALEAPDFLREAEVLTRHGLVGRALREALLDLGAPRNLAYRLALGHDDTDA